MFMRSHLIGATALLCLATSAFSQQTPSKVGVISIQGAIVGTKDGMKASQELDTKFVPKKKEFDTRQSEIAQLQDQYNKGGTVMAEEKRNQLAREIDEKKKRLERDTQDAEEDLKGEQQKVLQGLGQRMMAVIEKYAKDNGYSIILDVSNPNTPVLFASNTIDITQDIVSLYDKSAPAAGATPTSTPTSGPATTPRQSSGPAPTANKTPGTPRATPGTPR
jgi:outer membrane protein